MEKLSPKLAVADQLDRASTSIPLDIRRQIDAAYFDTARGSAWECAACLDVLVAKGKFTTDQVQRGKELLCETVCLLVGLIKSIAPDRLGEGSVEYGTGMERRGLEPVVYKIERRKRNGKKDGTKKRE